MGMSGMIGKSGSGPSRCSCGALAARSMARLRALGIDLGPQDHAPASIDLPYLKKTHFLAGQSGDQYAYPFWSLDEEPEPLQIFLPCERLTTLSDPQHVAFTPAAHELIPADFGALENITKPHKKKTMASSS
ncbi:hypothetical protein IGI04_023194 [Brassica rapa subsp. trilocularis]|uniref:Arabidopsis retrotransposon Orf1 C-terminal domain-containing protein n=1 Tax=Brassica rapa subsp. trilocularis TaxID=1813537 RepID=A0ABQ7M7B7_BRACM|nr:hypothetical protein IGI04_023194 [Brassica rapa subsp. trilocularis]